MDKRVRRGALVAAIGVGLLVAWTWSLWSPLLDSTGGDSGSGGFDAGTGDGSDWDFPGFSQPGDDDAQHTAGPARVTLEGGTLFVDGEPFPPIRCVGFQPAPVGVSPAWGYRWTHFPENYRNDLAALDAMGANAVMVNVQAAGEPDALRAFMSAALEHDIRTILLVDGPNRQDASDPGVAEPFLQNVSRSVQLYADHPGLIMWFVGNEVDYLYPNASRVGDWYALLERAVQHVHEADPGHPVLTANNPVTPIEEFTSGSPSVDVFGTNAYSLVDEKMRHYLEDAARGLGGKPVFVTEFGVDAYNTATNSEADASQARILANAWEGIVAARDSGAPVLGGCVHEWTDQWWKDEDPNTQSPDPRWRAPNLGVLPDDTFSEEWFGLVRIAPDTLERSPREAYWTLAGLWGGTAAP